MLFTEISMEYLTIKQTSEKWGYSSWEVIAGTLHRGTWLPAIKDSYWAIPADAEKPNDKKK